jgi:hypothetical protein
MSDKFDPAPPDKYSGASQEAIKEDLEIDAKLKARLIEARFLHQIRQAPFSHLPPNLMKEKVEEQRRYGFAPPKAAFCVAGICL